jgi:hypothetical protein
MATLVPVVYDGSPAMAVRRGDEASVNELVGFLQSMGAKVLRLDASHSSSLVAAPTVSIAELTHLVYNKAYSAQEMAINLGAAGTAAAGTAAVAAAAASGYDLQALIDAGESVWRWMDHNLCLADGEMVSVRGFSVILGQVSAATFERYEQYAMANKNTKADAASKKRKEASANDQGAEAGAVNKMPRARDPIPNPCKITLPHALTQYTFRGGHASRACNLHAFEAALCLSETGKMVLTHVDTNQVSALEQWCQGVLEKGAAAQDAMTRVGRDPYAHFDKLPLLLPSHLQERYRKLGVIDTPPHLVLQIEGQPIEQEGTAGTAGVSLDTTEFLQRWIHTHLFNQEPLFNKKKKMPILIVSPNGETMVFAQLAPGRVFVYDSHRKHVATVDEMGVMRIILAVYGLATDATSDQDLLDICATCSLEMSFFASCI